LRYEIAESQAWSFGFSSLFQDQFLVTCKGILELEKRLEKKMTFVNAMQGLIYTGAVGLF